MIRRTIALGLLYVLLLALIENVGPRAAFADASGESTAGQRGAAAAAYDRGTEAYLQGDFAKAAQWFETANRMAPAAPALMQAVRAHQKADNSRRAATLALRLKQEYPADGRATDYADNVLKEYAPQLVRVDVTCDQDCKVDLDGTLQDFQSFFLAPGTEHKVIASFETGDVERQVIGQPGEVVVFEAQAPPPQVKPEPDTATEPVVPAKPGGEAETHSGLPPLVTLIGAAVTGAWVVGTVVIGLSATSANDDYEKATGNYNNCTGDACDPLREAALKKQKTALDAQKLTNIFIGVSAAAGVATGVIALFFTDWSGGDDEPASDVALRIVPSQNGVTGLITGQF